MIFDGPFFAILEFSHSLGSGRLIFDSMARIAEINRPLPQAVLTY